MKHIFITTVYTQKINKHNFKNYEICNVHVLQFKNTHTWFISVLELSEMFVCSVRLPLQYWRNTRIQLEYSLESIFPREGNPGTQLQSRKSK